MSRSGALIFFLFALPSFASDLTVGWISREPEISYVVNSTNPRVEGWPLAGAEVVWRAHVRSWFDQAREIEYVWRLDGLELKRGTTTIAPNTTSHIDLPRPWSFTRERLSIEIDTARTVPEQSETNNDLEIFTDALAIGFWVEQSLYDHFRAKQRELEIGSTCWENWAQRHIDLFNDLAAMAVYPETPQGVLDRWRLQKIVVVPDGALPVIPLPNLGTMDGEPNGSTHPDTSDRSVDMSMGFRSGALPAYQDTKTLGTVFHIAPVVLHELGHARSATDVYAFDIESRPPAKVVSIEENGQPIAGSVFFGQYLFSTPEHGLMNRHFSFIDRYTAMYMNRIAGQRALRNHSITPEPFVEFLNELPAQNRVTIRDENGQPIPNATVEIFQSMLGAADAWYATNYDDVPDLELATDDDGRVLVGRSPFAPDGHVVNDWRGSNAVAIVRATKNGIARYGFLEARTFNMAWWRGETAFADHDLRVARTPCPRVAVRLLGPSWDTTLADPHVTLRWLPEAVAESFTVWAATPGHPPRVLGTTTAHELTIPLSGVNYLWVEADLGACGSLRSEATRVRVQSRMRRRAVRP